jgi:hypothetical protein
VNPVQKTIEQGIEKVEEKEPAPNVEGNSPTGKEWTPDSDKEVENKEEKEVEKIVDAQREPAPHVPMCEQDPNGQFTLFGKPQFWRNHVHLPSKGIIHGAVKVSDMKEFFARAPKTLDLKTWMHDVDLVEQRVEKAKAKAKSRK